MPQNVVETFFAQFDQDYVTNDFLRDHFLRVHARKFHKNIFSISDVEKSWEKSENSIKEIMTPFFNRVRTSVQT